jgi:hypothetical protein
MLGRFLEYTWERPRGGLEAKGTIIAKKDTWLVSEIGCPKGSLPRGMTQIHAFISDSGRGLCAVMETP